jgi:hypothetical protein
MNRRKSLCLVTALLLAAGCDSRLVKVTGKLTYRGQPVPSTLVVFKPEDGGRSSKGVTNADGEFTLHYGRQEMGATRGRHTVCLSYVVSNEEELGQAGPRVSRELKAVIGRYGDPKKSPLRYEVKESGQFIEINLEDAQPSR